MRVDESEGMRGRVRAAASLFFLAAQARPLSPLFLASQARPLSLSRVSWVDGGRPKTPRAERRWRCSYRSVERILYVFWLDRSVLVLFDRWSWLKSWTCDRHDVFYAPPPVYNVPGGHSSNYNRFETFLHKKYFRTFLLELINRITLAPQGKCLLGHSFFDQSEAKPIR